MADDKISSEEHYRTPLSPILGTPCDELDVADIFEGYNDNPIRESFEESNEIGDSPSSSSEQEFEDIYNQALGVTPPRNVRRIKEKSRTNRKGQGMSLKMPEIRAEVEKQKKRDRDRGRENNQTQLRTERAYMRQFKRDNLADNFPQDVDLSKSLNLPSVKIESRRFMSLKCTRKDRGRLKRSESDPKNLGQNSTDLSNHRQEFLRTFSLLIKIGAHARQHKDNQFALSELERQTSEEHKKWQVKLCLALWLELRAWHSGRTMEEQDKFLIEERSRVDEVFDKIINFNLNKLTSISNGDEEFAPSAKEINNDKDKQPSSCHDTQEVCSASDQSLESSTDTAPTNTQHISNASTAKEKRKHLKLILKKPAIDENNPETYKTKTPDDTLKNLNVLRTDSLVPIDESTPVKASSRASTSAESKDQSRSSSQELENAMYCIESVLDEIEAVEHLYSTQKSVGEAHPKYVSDSFTKNYEGLVLWMNLINEMLHKLCLVARFIGIHQGPGKLWQDWYDIGMGMAGKLFILLSF